MIVLFALYAVLAMSLNMLFGYAGYLSLAHAGYFAVGAYAYAVGRVAYGLGTVASVAIGIGIAAVLSLGLSLPAWRFRGDFFVLISLAVQALLFSLFSNLYEPATPLGSGGNLTNGPFGIAAIPRLVSHPRVSGTTLLLVLTTATAVACFAVAWRLLSAPWGHVLRAIRDDELVARSLGKRVRLAKVQVFAISCSMAALAGAWYATYVTYVDPSSASLDQGILILAMLLIGGAGNLRGPLVGTLVLLLLPEALRLIHVPDVHAGNLRLLVYGTLLVLLMHMRPQGLGGEYRLE
jgi:branched-chain amino acid transport system permease protein